MQQLQTDYNDVTALKQKDATLEQKLMELQNLSTVVSIIVHRKLILVHKWPFLG